MSMNFSLRGCIGVLPCCSAVGILSVRTLLTVEGIFGLVEVI